MGSYMITIDGGTTNTRVALWDGSRKLTHIAKSGVGVKDTAREGSNARLKNAIKEMIEEVVQKEKITYNEIGSVYACGMLTSNVGICEVPHLAAPAGVEDYVKGVKEVSMPEICPVPVCLIPGMKNFPEKVTMDNLARADIMRGEETETIALMELCSDRDTLYILPGSHTKFVSVDKDGRMTGCLTSMAGELLALLTENSILADAVKKKFAPAAYDREMLLAGARKTWETGLSHAAFLTRIISQFITEEQAAGASFLLGVVLAADVLAVKGDSALTVTEDTKVVVAGKEPLRSALKDIFEADGTFREVLAFRNEKEIPLSGYGMCVVADWRNKRYKAE